MQSKPKRRLASRSSIREFLAQSGGSSAAVRLERFAALSRRLAELDTAYLSLLNGQTLLPSRVEEISLAYLSSVHRALSAYLSGSSQAEQQVYRLPASL